MRRSYPDNDPSKIHPVARLLSDILPALVILLVVIVALYGYAGTWPPAVSITSSSMEPNIHRGDEVLIQGLSKTPVHTVTASKKLDYTSFGYYGDVIVYHPLGRTNATPVIHRAMFWVNESEPMWPGGPAATHSGYITLGDNNRGYVDQLPDSGICPLEPVKPEWILGVAKYDVPYLGYVRALLPF